MIQRIQSIYLFITVICLTFISFGADIFSFTVKEAHYTFSAYGVQKFDTAGKLLELKSSVLYLSTIALSLLCLLAIFSYKNLNRQLRLVRIIFFIYLVLMAGFIYISSMASEVIGETIKSQSYNLGFYLFIAGFPFIFLANLGIKRDKKLLDSLNRLR